MRDSDGAEEAQRDTQDSDGAERHGGTRGTLTGVAAGP